MHLLRYIIITLWCRLTDQPYPFADRLLDHDALKRCQVSAEPVKMEELRVKK